MVCCQVLCVLFQGMQLSSMKGDLLSVDYESSEEGEMEEEEEEEERVVVSETSKARWESVCLILGLLFKCIIFNIYANLKCYVMCQKYVALWTVTLCLLISAPKRVAALAACLGCWRAWWAPRAWPGRTWSQYWRRWGTTSSVRYHISLTRPLDLLQHVKVHCLLFILLLHDPTAKNVAADIASQLCDSVAKKLEGKVMGTFTSKYLTYPQYILTHFLKWFFICC